MTIRACINLTKLEHQGSEYPRHSSEPICGLGPFLVEDGYRSVESCRSRQLLGKLAYPDSACRFFSGLEFFRVFLCETDLLVKIF